MYSLIRWKSNRKQGRFLCDGRQQTSRLLVHTANNLSSSRWPQLTSARTRQLCPLLVIASFRYKACGLTGTAAVAVNLSVHLLVRSSIASTRPTNNMTFRCWRVYFSVLLLLLSFRACTCRQMYISKDSKLWQWIILLHSHITCRDEVLETNTGWLYNLLAMVPRLVLLKRHVNRLLTEIYIIKI